MSKFETAVLVLLMGFSFVLNAESTKSDTEQSGREDGEAAMIHFCERKTDEDCLNFMKSEMAKFRNLNGPCDKQVQRLKDVEDKFNEACGAASLSGKCINAFRDCENNPEGKVGGSQSHDKNAPLNVEAEKTKDAKCPAMASGDLKDYEDKLDKEQEKLDKLKDDVPKLESDQAQATKDAQKDIADKKKEYAQNQADYSKELSQIGKDKDAKDKEIQQQLNTMNADLQKINDSIRQLELQKMDAKVKMLDAKTQIELNCHATASSQVGTLQAEVIPLLKTNNYNVGSMTNLMRNVGLTDRQSWQRVAYQRYLWCMQSKPTTDSQASANRIYQLALAQAASSKQSLVQQQGQLNKQIGQIANSNGCGQAQGALNGETAACQNIRQAQNDAQTAQAGYNAKQDSLQQDITAAQQAASAEWTAKAKAIASKNQQIKDEETRIGNLQDLLQAKYAAGGHGNSDSKALSKAFSLFDTLKMQADAVVTCNNNKSADACAKDSDCQYAKTLLGHMNAPVPDAHRNSNAFSTSSTITSQDDTTTVTPQERLTTPESGATGPKEN